MGRKQREEEEPVGTRSKPSLVSRIKAKVKTRNHGQTDAEAVSSTAPSMVDRPILFGSPTVLPSNPDIKVDSKATEHTPAIANEPSRSINTGSLLKPSKSSLWTQALEVVAPDTRRWIESLQDLGILSQDGDKSDRSWTDNLIETIKTLASKCRDKSQRITIGEMRMPLENFAASAVTLLTTIGDIAAQFASPASGIIWPLIKAFLQVCRPTIFRIRRYADH